jgi:hypothetical protein
MGATDAALMRNGRTGTWIVAGAGLLGTLLAAGRADAYSYYPDGMVEAVAAGAVLLPSEFGVVVPTEDASTSRFVLGWSLQFPVSMLFPDPTTDHRVVAGVDLLPQGGTSWRGRLGYRYGSRHVFGGAGVGLDGSGANLSPELGVKFLHGESESRGGDGVDLSLHLLARAELASGSNPLRGVTVLFGWNIL